ncbi:hypothetical protein KST83_03915 [Fusobacterium nucleatum]|uniref:Uncharacterized protein n=1 Tax=Fusobacterium nucleatum subsp. polymorphum TaxID=76857 RepID=A0A2C6B0T0_FUSNP|nr:hypothetical protein [Fusobacterium polymorphum]PHH97783.1 hypothetical protein CA840_11060 [Fusobacterium polymorphum]
MLDKLFLKELFNFYNIKSNPATPGIWIVKQNGEKVDIYEKDISNYIFKLFQENFEEESLFSDSQFKKITSDLCCEEIDYSSLLCKEKPPINYSLKKITNEAA